MVLNFHNTVWEEQLLTLCDILNGFLRIRLSDFIFEKEKRILSASGSIPSSKQVENKFIELLVS